MMNVFNACVEAAFNKTKSLLWPLRRSLWIKLFFLFLLTGSCGSPPFSLPTGSSKDSETKASFESMVQEKTQQAVSLWEKVRPYVYVIAGTLTAAALALFFVMLWLFSRLQFVLLASLNAGETRLRDFWKQTQAAGQSYFTFNVWVYGVSLLVFLATSAAAGFGLYSGITEGSKTTAVVSLIALLTMFSIFALGSVFYWLIARFVPIFMLENNEAAVPAWRRLWAWLVTEPWKALVWLTFYSVLVIGVSILLFMVGAVVAAILAVPFLLGSVVVAFLQFSLIVKAVAIAAVVFVGGIVAFILMLALTVPVQTFFTYLRIELVRKMLSGEPPQTV